MIMPSDDDWDEASVRSTAAEATESHIAEVQPGPLDWKEGMEAQALVRARRLRHPAKAAPEVAQMEAAAEAQDCVTC